MALSVRYGTCDAQLEALPKDSISSQLLDPVGVLTSTAVVLMHKLEQDELITRMSKHQEGNELMRYGKESWLRRLAQAVTSERSQKSDKAGARSKDL